ncbi:GH12197 [Drosophila grimshawi]|uniref:GH12197 n=1 Tax=Drosophila grimshawi TaxID=7222 RepID=B4K3Q9_DROGR|nr:GH25223 [Drosophila grimshawi]EDW04695.1 GH12197 [Drosophila grimshawi]
MMTWENVTLHHRRECAQSTTRALCLAFRVVYVWSERDGYRKAWNNQVRVR